jgi:hypothetical protein
MRLARVLVLVGLFSLIGAGQVLAGPSEPTRTGVTSAVLLSLITQTGDDTFSTTDTPLGTSTPTQHFGPFSSMSPDSGTCGNNWAEDTFDRHFTVRNNGDGTFTVVEQFKNGIFVTTAGPSPGGCDTDPGGTIAANKTGALHGYEIITVVGMQTSTDSSCIVGMPTAPCTTTGFIESHFAGSVFNVSTFFFHYSAGDQSLAASQWKNASCDRGGNDGDIASILGPTGLQKTILCP